MSCSTLIVHRNLVSPTLNVHPTLFVIPCHLESVFSSKFQSSMTICHHKLIIGEGRVLANGWTHPSSMTILFLFSKNKNHMQSYRSDLKYHMTLIIIFWCTAVEGSLFHLDMCWNVEVGYKWVLANVNMTRGKIWGENREPSTVYFVRHKLMYIFNIELTWFMEKLNLI